MSEAIRCEACRWWQELKPIRGVRRGVCEVDLPVYVCDDPNDHMSWYQPVLSPERGCSRGEPKETEPQSDDTELLQAKVMFHRRISSDRLDEIGRLNLELSRLRQFVDRVRVDAERNPELYAPFVALLRDLKAAEVSA